MDPHAKATAVDVKRVERIEMNVRIEDFSMECLEDFCISKGLPIDFNLATMPAQEREILLSCFYKEGRIELRDKPFTRSNVTMFKVAFKRIVNNGGLRTWDEGYYEKAITAEIDREIAAAKDYEQIAQEIARESTTINGTTNMEL